MKSKKITKNASNNTNKDVKKKDNSFMYYPDLDDPDFYMKLSSKKEFIDAKSSKQSYSDDPIKKLAILNNNCQSKVFKLAQHQIFVRNFLSPQTPYNSLLAFHEVGTGKTCAAVTIAEAYKEIISKYDKKIYVLATKLLRENFEDTLYSFNKEKFEQFPGSLQCTGTTYYHKPKINETKSHLETRKEIVHDNIVKYYELNMGYRKFANYVTQLEKDGISLDEHFSNSVFIIDEGHNLVVSSSKNKDDDDKKNEDNLDENTNFLELSEYAKAAKDALEKIFSKAHNTKLIILTATPMINEIDDIVVLINLLRANDHKEQFKLTDLKLNNKKNLTFDNLNQEKFINFIKGYISYIRGEHPSTFPTIINQNRYIRDIAKFNMYGDILKTNIPDLKYLNVVQCEMSFAHFEYHFTHMIMNNKNTVKYKKAGKYLLKYNPDTRDVKKLQTITGAYPFISNNTQLLNYKLYSLNDSPVKVIKSSHSKTEHYNYKNNLQFFNVDNENDLHIHNRYPAANNTIGYPLAQYSTKFYHCLYDIINTFGINFIYTQFIETGTVPLSLILEQNGYVRWHPSIKLQDDGTYSHISNYLNIKNTKKRCICGHLYEQHSKTYNSNNNYTILEQHKFRQATYIRSDGITKDDFLIAKSILNSNDNKIGEIIKVIVGGKQMSEGVDLKFVQSVHIINPWHNLIQIEQTIGRGARFCSHSLLEVDMMNVKVFKYVAIPPQTKDKNSNIMKLLNIFQQENELVLDISSFNNYTTWKNNINSNNFSSWLSSDEFIYNRALNKDFDIKHTIRIMKKYAVDCLLNNQANQNFPNDQNGSRNCDYQNCNYTCFDRNNNELPLTINTDTYDMYFMIPKIKDTQIIISKLFTKYWALTLRNITMFVQEINPNIDNDIIYLTLNHMLNDDNSFVIDQYDRYGYLIYKHPYYIFQPDEINDQSLPLELRKIPALPHKKRISLDPLINKSKQKIDITDVTYIRNKNLTKIVGQDINKPVISPRRFANIIENDIDMHNIADYTVLESLLDYYTIDKHEYLIKTRVQTWINKHSNKDTKTINILTYYFNNFILANTTMNYNTINKIINIPTTGSWIINLYGKYLKFDNSDNTWNVISDNSSDINKIIGNKPKINKLSVNHNFYGFIDPDNKGKFNFKIFKKLETKFHKRDNSKINRKMLARGKVCNTYSIDELCSLATELNINNIKCDTKILNRPELCNLIQNKLKSLNDNKKLYFLNYFNFIRYTNSSFKGKFGDYLYKLYNK